MSRILQNIYKTSKKEKKTNDSTQARRPHYYYLEYLWGIESFINHAPSKVLYINTLYRYLRYIRLCFYADDVLVRINRIAGASIRAWITEAHPRRQFNNQMEIQIEVSN